MLQNITELLGDGSLEGSCLEWMAFMENDITSWPFGGAIHQQPHWSRVLVLATHIAQHEGLSEADIEALSMAASFHDTRRLSPGPDQGHGARAAEYYKQFCHGKGLHYDPRAYLAIKWHDRDDEEGIAAIGEWMSKNPMEDGWKADALDIYRIFKDSDNLDRIRIGEDALDMGYIRLPYSKTLKPFATDLLAASQLEGTREDDPVRPRRWLVVIDVQNDFVDGALGTPEAVTALPAMVDKAAGFDGTVTFTKDTHTKRYMDTLEGENLPVPHCVARTEGWEFAPQMQRVYDERGGAVYMKETFGCPPLAEDLETAFARGNVDSVELIGLCTDICVVSNALAIKAKMPNLRISVDSGCCAGTTPERHEAALETMRSCQIDVV